MMIEDEDDKEDDDDKSDEDDDADDEDDKDDADIDNGGEYKGSVANCWHWLATQEILLLPGRDPS